MALKDCKECGKQVSTKAKTCPTCGAPAQRATSALAGCFTMIAAAFVVLVLVAVIGAAVANPDGNRSSSPASDASPSGSTPPAPAKTWRDRDDSSMAYVMMQGYVKQRLRSPSTADFPLLWDQGRHVKHLGNQVYLIQSYVDAQNGFGATTRITYEGKIEQVSEDQNWRLVSLEIFE